MAMRMSLTGKGLGSGQQTETKFVLSQELENEKKSF
jgi:hypothetical protein